MQLTAVGAVDIPDAWFQCIYKILENGFRYEIQHGSFVGQTRLEFDWITVFIKKPYAEPYDMMLPKIPPHFSLPDPVEPGYIEKYLPYLMTGERNQNEDYTYGERLCKYYAGSYFIRRNGFVSDYLNQINYWEDILRKTPQTNQAVLQIAQPTDCMLNDPPCLRHIDMRIRDGKLVFYPYFRSWDLWAGFPANLAGIAVLQDYMAQNIGAEVGSIIASSKGLHIYGYAEELARIRANKEGQNERMQSTDQG